MKNDFHETFELWLMTKLLITFKLSWLNFVPFCDDLSELSSKPRDEKKKQRKVCAVNYKLRNVSPFSSWEEKNKFDEK